MRHTVLQVIKGIICDVSNDIIYIDIICLYIINAIIAKSLMISYIMISYARRRQIGSFDDSTAWNTASKKMSVTTVTEQGLASNVRVGPERGLSSAAPLGGGGSIQANA